MLNAESVNNMAVTRSKSGASAKKPTKRPYQDDSSSSDEGKNSSKSEYSWEEVSDLDEDASSEVESDQTDEAEEEAEPRYNLRSKPQKPKVERAEAKAEASKASRVPKVEPAKAQAAVGTPFKPGMAELRPGTNKLRKVATKECPKCGKILARNGIARHLLTCSGRNVADPIGYQCPVCDKFYTNKSNLVQHFRNAHSRDIPQSVRDLPAPVPLLDCECGASYTRTSLHAKKCAALRKAMGLPVKKSLPVPTDKPKDDHSPPSPPPARRNLRSASFGPDEMEEAYNLRIRYGLTRVVNPEIVAWVVRTFSHINSPRLEDRQVREALDQLPDRIARMIQTLEKEQSRVALINGIKIIYGKVREAQARRQ